MVRVFLLRGIDGCGMGHGAEEGPSQETYETAALRSKKITPALDRATGAGKKYYAVIIGLSWEEVKKMAYYLGIGPEDGTIVEEEQAFDYALERCLEGTLEDQKAFREELVEWYYSGNWIKRGGDAPV